MSIGYGGGCRKYGESAEFVIYEYYAYDWNTEGCDNPKRIYDGIIKIEKSARICNGHGYVGLRLIRKIFSEYQKNGVIPHIISIHA